MKVSKPESDKQYDECAFIPRKSSRCIQDRCYVFKNFNHRLTISLESLLYLHEAERNRYSVSTIEII